MSEKAFTMASSRYCGSCGSFDLVKTKPGWIYRRFMHAAPKVFCYGCDNQFPEHAFVYNAIRTVPSTSDDFFYQTNIRNRQLKKTQVQPLTQVLGISIIAAAVASLFLYQFPKQSRVITHAKIEWADAYPNATAAYRKGVVKSLQLGFDKLVQSK